MALLIASSVGIGIADIAMTTTYDRLASDVVTQLSERRVTDGALWIGIAGGPGAGKSTLAAAVSKRVNQELGPETSVVLPMDGFHYSRAELRRLDPPDASSFLPRRGSPWTFDAEGLCDALHAAKRTGSASLPTYSREISDPLPDGVRLEASNR